MWVHFGCVKFPKWLPKILNKAYFCLLQHDVDFIVIMKMSVYVTKSNIHMQLIKCF